MKLGAFDFITMPIQPEVVRLKHERALELCAARRGRRKADAMTEYLRAEADGKFPDLIGAGDKLAAVRRALEKIGPSETTVFISGESGTGKELIARAIHRLSKRAAGPFVKVNCGALTETLLESELFGHEKGAFTGAIKQKLGRFELADGGTLFLDEVGDVPPAMQVKLLRALQEREIERVGGESSVKVDVRIVSATNKDLDAEVAAGRFRQDLFFRLHVLPVKLPPLRDRRDDIPLLAAHFVAKLAPKTNAAVRGVTDAALGRLMAYAWPGNERELENAIERGAGVRRGRSDHAGRPARVLARRRRHRGSARGGARAVASRDPRRSRASVDPQGVRQGRQGQDRDRALARHQDVGALLQAREVQDRVMRARLDRGRRGGMRAHRLRAARSWPAGRRRHVHARCAVLGLRHV